jgi:hypothetical protein
MRSIQLEEEDGRGVCREWQAVVDAGHELRQANKKKVTQEVTDILEHKQNMNNLSVHSIQKCNNQCNKEVFLSQ